MPHKHINTLTLLLLLFSLDAWAQHPVVQRVIDKDPHLIVERQQNEHSYIVAIAIDKNTRTSYLLSRYGFIADSVAVSPADFQLITEKKVSAFAHYQAVVERMTELTKTARQQIRNSGSLDKNWTFTPVISNMVPELDTTKGHLQKLLLLDNFAREFYISSFLATHLKTKSGAAEGDSLPGAPGTFQHLGDSTVYFNSNLLAEQQKAVMYPNKNILIFYNINNVAIDTVTVSSPVQARLLKEKTDVFLLYRGWLETQKIAINERRALLADVAQKPVLQLAVNKNAKQAVLKVLAENKREAEAIEEKLDNASRPGTSNITRLLEQQTKYVPENRFLLESLGMGYTTQFNRGTKKYELTDHRGNVMGVVTDRKLPVDAGTYNLQCYPCFPGLPCPPCAYVLSNPNPDGITDYYTADVAQVTDYFPFGMSMPGRKFSNGELHRFGYNGKENDNDIDGQQDYGFRIYDNRLGRFKSVDPLSKSYPWYTPYQFAGNKPIWAIDLDGAEELLVSDKLKSNGAFNTILELVNSSNVISKFVNQFKAQHNYVIVYTSFYAARDAGNGAYQDAGWTGATRLLKSKSDWENEYVANPNIKYDEIKGYIESGKKVIVVGVSEQALNYGGETVAENNTPEAIFAEIDAAFTLIHELLAHAEGMSKGTNKGGEQDHMDFQGEKSGYSPTFKELLTEKKYKNTKAGKLAKKFYEFYKKEVMPTITKTTDAHKKTAEAAEKNKKKNATKKKTGT